MLADVCNVHNRIKNTSFNTCRSVVNQDMARYLAVVRLFLIHVLVLVGLQEVCAKLERMVSNDGKIYGKSSRVALNASSVLQLVPYIESPGGTGSGVGPRVAYGNTAAPGDFPYIGLTYIDLIGGGSAQCVSTKISDRVALTAAHCLSSGVASIQAAYGIVNSAEFSSKQIDSYSYIYREDFNEFTSENDIGLIAFPTAINAESVALGTIAADQLPSPLYVAGWGKTEGEYLNTDNDVSEELKYAAVPYVSQSDCANTYISWGIGGLPPSHICAGGIRADACQGDSGGPLSIEGARWPTAGYTTNIQVGVTSFGPVPCGGPLNIGAYTNVAPFTKWINDEIWYNNWEGRRIPSVLNSKFKRCFSGAVIESSFKESGGDCCAACKANSQCGTWDYDLSGTCTLHAVGGFSETNGICDAGWLNRDTLPSGVQVQNIYYEYTGATLLVETGAVSAGGCAEVCKATQSCKYFTYIGEIGNGNQYNDQGANCQLADAGATPVQGSPRFTGATSGFLDGSVTPVTSPSPPPPSTIPLPSPPSPPEQKECSVSEGTYVISSADRSCSAKYLGHNSFQCKSTSVKMQKKTSDTASQFVIELDKKNGMYMISAVKKCRTSRNKLTLSFSKPYTKSVYLSQYSTSWKLISADGDSCSKVALQANSRYSSRSVAYLTRGSSCRPSVYRSSNIQGTRQYWYLKKVSSSVSKKPRKCV